MRRQCYGSSDAIDQMHHASRSFPIPLSPPPRERSRNGPITRPARRPSPQQDSESEKGGNNARKRINVACARCRKRKIRCSGDQGTGVCQNCKNAGSENCEFLRVNSTPASMTGASWTYAHSGISNSSPMIRNSLGQYPAFAGSNLASTPYSGQNHPMHSLPSNPYPYGPSRQSYPAAYSHSHSYSDDVFPNFGLQQTSHYHSTAQEPHLPSLDYLSPEMVRQWTPVAMDDRQPPHSLNLSHESSSRMTPAQHSQPISVPVGTSHASGTNLFPGLASLKNNLPSFGSHISRTLPVPESQRTSISQSSVSSTSGDSALTGIPQTLSYRPSIPWNAEKGAPEEASNSSTSSTMSGNGPTSSKSSSSPQATQKQTALGFQTAASNPSSREMYYGPSSITASMSSTGGQLDPDNVTFHGRLAKDHQIANQQQAPGHYGYSLGSNTRAGTTGNQVIQEGTLMNGQIYTRLEEPQQPYENLPVLSGEGGEVPQRTSISNLTSTRLF